MTQTVVLSRHGAGIVSKRKLMAEQELVLQEMATNREVEVRVVGEIAKQGEMHTYGVAFLNESLDFWRVEFPPAPQRDERPAMLVLECGGCKGVAEIANGDFEYDICAIHGGLARHCEDCGLLTVWRQSTELMPTAKRAGAKKTAMPTAPVAEAEEAVPEVLALADAMEGADRPGRVRAKVNFCACVRSEKFGEDIVACVDMSRGGVSFRSRNGYVKGQPVRIAVPYSREAKDVPAIFVRGRIANVKEIAGAGMYLCGVEFLRGEEVWGW